MATAALIGAVMTRIFTGENPKDRPIIASSPMYLTFTLKLVAVKTISW
jgi:hypothetical protein